MRLLWLCLSLSATACASGADMEAVGGAARWGAPPPPIRGLDGATLHLDLRAPERPTLVVFASAACPMCARDAGRIRVFAGQMAGAVDVLYVLGDRDAGRAGRFARRHRLRGVVAWDPGAALAQHFGAVPFADVPQLLLIGRRGEVYARAQALTEVISSQARDLAAARTAQPWGSGSRRSL